MGDTDCHTDRHCVCGTGGVAVAIPRAHPVYRCRCAHDLFLDYVVPPTNQGLGYTEASRADPHLYFYLDMSSGRSVARS